MILSVKETGTLSQKTLSLKLNVFTIRIKKLSTLWKKIIILIIILEVLLSTSSCAPSI